MSYNGYTNYETWAVVLWMDNEADPYQYRCQLTERAQLLARSDTRSAATILADMLQDWISGNNPLTHQASSVYSDLLTRSLSQVNWLEIAHSFLSE